MNDESFQTKVVWQEGEDASWIEWQCSLCDKVYPAGVAAFCLFGDLWLCYDCGRRHKPATAIQPTNAQIDAQMQLMRDYRADQELKR